MLELAQALAKCNQEVFKGWVIAGVDVEISGKAEIYSNEILVRNKRRSIILVQGRSSDGKLKKQLKVILMLPRQLGCDDTKDEELADKPSYEHIFSVAEVSEYLARVGDENIIHRQPRPIVPGMLLLSWLQKTAGIAALNWKVRFVQPVYSGETVSCCFQEQTITAYVNGAKVFIISKK